MYKLKNNKKNYWKLNSYGFIFSAQYREDCSTDEYDAYDTGKGFVCYGDEYIEVDQSVMDEIIYSNFDVLDVL